MTQSMAEDTLRREVEESFAQIPNFLRSSLRSLPKETGDYSYPMKKIPPSLVEDVKNLKPRDLEIIAPLLKKNVAGDPLNDREFVMEKLIQLICELPVESKASSTLSDLFVDEVWNSLLHPPLMYLGDDMKYRQPDGSKNNPLFPQLGASNTPYARTCPSKTVQTSNLPDAGVIFDSLMARKQFTPHPAGISALFFYIVSILIHDLFRTSRENVNFTSTSSYLDLAPLYGSTATEQASVRTFQDGQMKPDCFFEKRLLGFPPGVSCVLVMLNRFHNLVAEQLAAINEGGRFSKPRNGLTPEKSKTAWAKYDNDLFQTARLIICGFYVNVILNDYAGVILGLNRVNTPWHLDPRNAMETNLFNEDNAPRGIGNQCSVEFNLIYRWHACISEADDKWSQEFYNKLFPGKKVDEISLPLFLATMAKWEDSLPEDPSKRIFGGLKRGDDGKFADDDLVDLLISGIEEHAGAFGPQRIPVVLKAVEILGIEQARAWNVASLNEFRQFFGLTKHETFEDVNPDEYISDQLRRLYDHPDNIELYPGLLAEDAKPLMSPGSGLCAPFTITRAILSDAITVVRGDRFNTIDYSPKLLTNWGFTTSNYDMKIARGCMLYKFILGVFPYHFKADSAYAHFPLIVPKENRKILEDIGSADQYSWEKPGRYMFDISVSSHIAAKQILQDSKRFSAFSSEAVAFLSRNAKHYPQFHPELFRHSPNSKTEREWKTAVKSFYEETTVQLFKQRAYLLAGINEVDIIRDIGNIIPIHFCAHILPIPLKTIHNPRGIYTEFEMFEIFSQLYTYLYTKVDPATSFGLTQTLQNLLEKLVSIILLDIDVVEKGHSIFEIIDYFRKGHPNHDFLTESGLTIVRELLKHGESSHIVWSQILPAAASMVLNQSKLFAVTLDYFINGAGKPHLDALNKLSNSDSPEADEELLRYFLEGSRLSAKTNVIRYASVSGHVAEKDTTITVNQGDRIFIDLVSCYAMAATSSTTIPNPDDFILERPFSCYEMYAAGPYNYLDLETTYIALTAIFKTVCRHRNLRAAPGVSGQLSQITGSDGTPAYLTAAQHSIAPYPTSQSF